jgi:hypothetical protein
MIFPLIPLFVGDFPLPRLITKGYKNSDSPSFDTPVNIPIIAGGNQYE